MIDRQKLKGETAGKIKAFREKLGISQAELARRSGVHFVTLNRIEQGTQLADWETICRLADSLGVKSDDLREKNTIPS